MTDEELIEEVAGAWRPEPLGDEIESHPHWHDLDDEGRVKAARRALRQRTLEAALDPEGLSTTALAVLGRIRRR